MKKMIIIIIMKFFFFFVEPFLGYCPNYIVGKKVFVLQY